MEVRSTKKPEIYKTDIFSSCVSEKLEVGRMTDLLGHEQSSLGIIHGKQMSDMLEVVVKEHKQRSRGPEMQLIPAATGGVENPHHMTGDRDMLTVLPHT